MERTDTKDRSLGWALGFFIYGAFVHFLLLRCFIYWAYSGTSETTFVKHPLSNWGIALLGGINVSFFMLPLRKNTSKRRSITSYTRVVLNAGLRAMAATVLTLELFYLLASAYLAVFSKFSADVIDQPSTLGRIAGMFVLWFLSIQTYGLQPAALSLPFSFLYGSIAGVAILRASSSLPDPSTNLT